MTDGDVVTGCAFSRLRAEPATLAVKRLFRRRPKPKRRPEPDPRMSVMRLKMNPLEENEFFRRVASTDMQLAGDAACKLRRK
jgi:hypothetical protein